MADLSDASFTNVNDVETAQGAPVSEAVAQKVGSNENNLNTRLTTAESDIATNTAAIAALYQPETDIDTSVSTSGTKFTASGTIAFAIIYATVNGADSDDSGTRVIVAGGSGGSFFGTVDGGPGTRTFGFSISGANLVLTVGGASNGTTIDWQAAIWS